MIYQIWIQQQNANSVESLCTAHWASHWLHVNTCGPLDFSDFVQNNCYNIHACMDISEHAYIYYRPCWYSLNLSFPCGKYKTNTQLKRLTLHRKAHARYEMQMFESKAMHQNQRHVDQFENGLTTGRKLQYTAIKSSSIQWTQHW